MALAFQPLRRRVVRLADRLAFGAAAAPYEALADFSRRLGDSPTPPSCCPRWPRPPLMRSTLAVPWSLSTCTAVLTGWPRGRRCELTTLRTSRVEIPVVDHGERLGSITVAMAAGHPLRPRDQQLLADLADQAGLAFRNAQLTAELSAQVEQLSLRTHASSTSPVAG